MTKILLTFILIWLPFCGWSQEKPLSIVIVGGGPSGLATAIVAKENGADVTLIEKRSSYIRMQILVLFHNALNQLEHWEVDLPELNVIDLGEKGKFGLIPINALEKGLEKRVNELGIKVLRAEFKDFKEPGVIYVISNEEEIELPYDFLVGADGTHSLVREKLPIPLDLLGKATGVIAMLPSEISKLSVLTAKHQDLFIRKIGTPSFNVLFGQSVSREKISPEELAEAAEECDWAVEAKQIENGETIFYSDAIEVMLQQVETFSNEEMGVILVGDSAASASFFQGMGANTALGTASLAGTFFKNVQNHKKEAFEIFNQSMKEATDKLIQDSLYLFVNSN